MLIGSLLPRYVDGSGYVDLRFDPYLKPFLLHLNGYYTKYQLVQIAQFQSRYSIRIYELLKMETFKKSMNGAFKKLFEYTELRAILGISENEYSRVADFKKNVIDVAVREINGRSDIYIADVIGVKPSRKIEYWEFHFQNARQTRLQIDPPPPTLEEVKDHPDDVNQLIAFGIAEEVAYKWRKKYGVAQIIRNLGFVTAKKNTGKVIEDLASYVTSAIARDFAKDWEDKAKIASEKVKSVQAEEEAKNRAYEENRKAEEARNEKLFAEFKSWTEEQRKSFVEELLQNSADATKASYKKKGEDHPLIRALIIKMLKQSDL